MRLKPRALWERIRDSLWFLPGLITAFAMVLAAVLVRVDGTLVPDGLAAKVWWLFGGGPGGARDVLSTIAGSVITVAGVVFSITIVALQLASTQFSPRVLQNFMSDRGNQTVLGVFVGTFTYTLLVLRTVRSADETGAGAFVPAAAVTFALLLAIASMGFLFYYLHHVTGWIEASGIIDRITHDTLRQIRHRYPIAFGVPDADDAGVRRQTSQMGGTAAVEEALPDETPGVLLTYRSGYVQLIDQDRMLEIATKRDLVVRIEHANGDFVLESTPILSVWPREALDETLERDLREAIMLGPRRTITQDAALGVIQLSDIAVKAMSPSVNDPTTAMLAIDRLGQIVAEFGGRYPGERVMRDDGDTVRVVRPAFDFESAVEIAFNQVRRYGASDPSVMSHLALTVADIATRVEDRGRSVLRRTIDEVEESVRLNIEHDADRRRVAAALAFARKQLGAAGS